MFRHLLKSSMAVEHQLEYYLQIYTLFHEKMKEMHAIYKYANSAGAPKLRQVLTPFSYIIILHFSEKS